MYYVVKEKYRCLDILYSLLLQYKIQRGCNNSEFYHTMTKYVGKTEIPIECFEKAYEIPVCCTQEVTKSMHLHCSITLPNRMTMYSYQTASLANLQHM